MKEIAALLAVFAVLLLAGCAQQTQPSPSLDKNFKALESQNKKLQAQIDGLNLKVGIYNSLNECKEKALVDFIDKNSGVQQTTLKDSLERCNSVFSAMKALAEKS